MYSAFCYCCKKHVTTPDEKIFRESGHVADRHSASLKYKINQVRHLPKDSQLGLKWR